MNVKDLTLSQLRTSKEKTLSAILTAFSALVWLVLTITIVPILYALFIALFIVIVQQLFLAYVRGNGVRVSERQFPELHARIVSAAQRLGLTTVPAAYVIQAGGALNAMATKLFSRNFIIIYSDLVEACADDERALDFVVGHELGHVALGHLKKIIWLAPGRILPLLGPAYSRACEYSCDRCGLVVAGELEPASRGLAILAAGRSLGRKLSLDEFSEQAKDSGSFWSAVYELNASHPFLTKRVRALRELLAPNSAPAVGRNPFAYPLAPFLGLPAAGATGSGMLMVVAVVGLMSAIAIPNFMKFQQRAKQTEAKALLGSCSNAQATYHAEHQRWGTSFDELGIADLSTGSYTLYMGKNQLGAGVALPDDNLRGFADAEDGFSCVAVANLDADETLDVWYVNPETTTPFHYVDDGTDTVNELN